MSASGSFLIKSGNSKRSISSAIMSTPQAIGGLEPSGRSTHQMISHSHEARSTKHTIEQLQASCGPPEGRDGELQQMGKGPQPRQKAAAQGVCMGSSVAAGT